MACHYVRILFPLELCLLETIPLSVVIFGMNTDTVIYILVKVVFSFSWSYVKFWGYIPKYFHKYYLTFKETTSLFFSIFYNRVHFNYYRIMQVETYKVFNFLLNLKAMVPDSSTLAWKISWTKEPGRLQSKGSRRVRQDWATSLSLFTFMHWRRKWQPTPVFLPGESQGQGSLVGCCLWGRTESDTTKVS